MLRIRGTRRDGQIVRLRSAKCLVGSAPWCTFRIRARGIQPLHCLIVRGPAHAVVRRWATDTRLNDCPFADALLTPGDRLGIGPVEFEVVDTGIDPAATPVASQGHWPPGALPARDPPKLVLALKQRLALARHQGRARARRLIKQLRAVRQQIADWEYRYRNWPQKEDRPKEQLAGAGLAGQAPRSEGPAADRHQAELEALRQRLEAWQAELDLRQAQLERSEAELEVRRRQLFSGEGSPEMPAPCPEAPAAQTRPESAEPPAPLAGPAPTRLEVATMHVQTVVQQQTALAEADPGWASSGEPPDGGDPACRTGGTVPETSSAAERPVHGVPLRRAARLQTEPRTSVPAEDQEESVEQYMARLLERVRAGQGGGGLADWAAEPGNSAGNGSLVDPSAGTIAPGGEGTEARQASKESSSPAARPRRAPTPDTPVDLGAMRELANLAAQTAIQRHVKRKLMRLGAGKLAVISLALISGAALVAMSWLFGGGDLSLYAGLFCLWVAAIWGFQYALLSGRMAAGRSRPLAMQAPDQTGQTPLPGQKPDRSG
ncbi:MAG: hypothetical protein ACUVUC_15195 [Thermoguttaceae bacterium]